MLIVSDAWTPQVNGVVRTYQNLVRELTAMGRTVCVIGPKDFPCAPLPTYPEIAVALWPYRRLAAMIERFRPEALHVPVEGPLGWAARRWCLTHGVPFSTAFHTNVPAYAAVRAPAPLRRGLEEATIAALRRFHAPARFVYVPTASTIHQLEGWGFQNRFVALSRGIDTTLFHPGGDPRPAGAAPVLLYVGRVAPEKNVESFLALATPGHKVVVGDGPLLAKLQAQHPEVTFHGTLLGEALAAAYRAADVFVFPSNTDTFGNVLLEALASGLPIAAHDVPGPRDIVGNDPRLGCLHADLKTAVAQALQAPGSRQARHAHVRRRYCWRQVARVFLEHAAELRP
ncbi:MAG: glycosyltransferase family 1 protein [Geminicoccaceae bacterium]|nr:MAG: glycosyltransferase family 1 protein [Geminicoccaceae bacterium]